MKNAIRHRIKAALSELPPGEIARKSLCIARTVEQLACFRSAKIVMLYLPIPGEVDVLPLARSAWSAGKTVVAPTACDHCRTMRAILCPPEYEEMFHCGFGLRQPVRGLGEHPPAEIDLVIVPAMAFDAQCNRLGRGGGFYDHFLARPDVRAEKVGVAFCEQVIPCVPTHEKDQPVDMVVTDTQTYTKEQG